MKDLLSCDGERFEANINGIKCTGIISVENYRVYLCQNKKDGKDCNNKKGYPYSWHVLTGSKRDLKAVGVSSFKLISEETYESKQYLPSNIIANILNRYEKCEISFSEMVNMLNKRIDEQVHIKYD